MDIAPTKPDLVGMCHNRTVLTLRDLLGQKGFELELLTGGEAALGRSIAGVHNSEMPNPSRFLPPEWIMLTLGMRLRGHALAQRELVRELDSAGLAGLGFGLGVAFEHVPRELLAAARACEFPIFTVPYETPFREIIGFVNRSLLSNDFRLVQRSLSMQNYLMEVVGDDDPIDALVQRLGGLFDRTVVLFDARGRVEAASREAPFGKIWARVESARPGIQHNVVEGSDALFIPVQPRGHPRRWLVVASESQTLPRQLAVSVLQTTERLLEMIMQARRAAAAEERVLRAELLASALSPHAGYDQVELNARMLPYGLDFTGDVRVMLIEADEAEAEASIDDLRLVLESVLEPHDLPALTAVRGQQVVALVQAEPAPISDLALELERSQPFRFRCGCGRPVRSIEHVPQSLQDAQVALRELLVRRSCGLLMFEQFDVASWLIGISPDDMRAKADAILGPLREFPELYETLVVYLRSNMHVALAAQRLHLHENSLRHRLSRIESLLDRSLRELATVVELYLATLALGGGHPQGARGADSVSRASRIGV